ncbi:MAG: S1-like domain-containing RNA-binding protein [Thiovulaceae bacterium]|nr:S1-like domain-containing RNA-binding protein [Sulfurimonadaceae bacterium]
MTKKISESMILGVDNILEVVRSSDFGLYLKSADNYEVLLPNIYVTEDMKIGDLIEVFIYTDSEDRMVAVTQKPKAYLGEFAYLEVVDVTKFGAFVDWGMPKDLLVPLSTQAKPYKKGEKHVIRVSFDNETHRLVGIGKSKLFMKRDTSALSPYMEVKIIVERKTPLGYKVIVNNAFEGMIFDDDIYQEINIGDVLKAYIKTIRPDGKLDISLRAIGANRDDDGMEKILSILKEKEGKMPYNSKSDPELVKKVFGLSKKAYKRALTSLREAGKIRVEEDGTYLVKEA